MYTLDQTWNFPPGIWFYYSSQLFVHDNQRLILYDVVEVRTMLEIRGKKNNAICFASQIDEKALEQIKRMCDYDLTLGSQIRIMPDVHAGKGCTIGTTMTIKDKVCPNIVGVDIGCGMYTVKLLNKEIDFNVIRDIKMKGRKIWN